MKKYIYASCTALIIFTTNAQVPWQKGGNSVVGGNITTIGTSSNWNAPFDLMTNGVIRMHLNENSTLGYGVYTYSLVADGQIVSTKRMMKQ